MPAAQAIRLQIERSLQSRFPAALSPHPHSPVDLAPTRIAEVDRLLHGGFPQGAITELVGIESSGRTSLALAFLAARTQEGQFCAWVDTSDTLDPESAAASGVQLGQLLWVRSRAHHSQANKPWSTLDQALRATDLVLQAGGFTAIVLDLGSISPANASRIPLATWFRFRQAAGSTRCSLLVIGQASYAKSSAALVLECRQLHPHSSGGSVLNAFDYQVNRIRQRHQLPPRKPPVSTWTASGSWQPEPAPLHPSPSLITMEKGA